MAQLRHLAFDTVPAPCRFNADPTPSLAAAISATSCSIAIVFSPWLAHLAKDVRAESTILFLEERYDQLWAQLSTTGVSRLRRLAFRLLEGWRFRRLYRQQGRRAALVVVISSHDREEFRQFVDPERIAVLRHGVDIDRFSPTDLRAEYDVITYGYTSLVNNADYLAEVIREVAKRSPVTVRWALAGPHAPAALSGLPGVVQLGRVEDIRECVSRASVVAVPTRVASGVKTTVLEAWALGKAVVASPLAMRGLCSDEDVHALTAESAPQFANQILRALREPALRMALGKAGRTLVQSEHDIRRLSRDFAAELADGRTGSPGAVG